jgi:translation initiation factor IF-2
VPEPVVEKRAPVMPSLRSVIELPPATPAAPRPQRVMQPQPRSAQQARQSEPSGREQPSFRLPTLSEPVSPPPRQQPQRRPEPSPREEQPQRRQGGPVIQLSTPEPVQQRRGVRPEQPQQRMPQSQQRPHRGGPVVQLEAPVPAPHRATGFHSESSLPAVDAVSVRGRQDKFPPPDLEAEEAAAKSAGGGSKKKDRRAQQQQQAQQAQLARMGALPTDVQGRFAKGKKPERGKFPMKPLPAPTPQMRQEKKVVRIAETIVLAELAKAMGIKATELIMKLLTMGMRVTINQSLDYETASLLANEFGWEIQNTTLSMDEMLNIEEDLNTDQVPRPPVVTIMGHVDHGKTTLLDALRKANVAAGEAGGITQHIGAYQVATERGVVVFLDTPGHEAFTKMRARGATVTDVVVLVVAADDGVKPQTVEAIQHAKAAKVPIVVAINKIDKPGADPSRVKTDLLAHGIVGEEYGGETMMVEVSAKQRKNLTALLDTILLQSEVLELKANRTVRAEGVVIESRLDRGRGPVATLLVQKGVICVGDAIVSGRQYGRVRALYNDRGKPVDEAGPSIPVEVLGMSGVPNAGDTLHVVEDEATARRVAEYFDRQARLADLAAENKRRSIPPVMPTGEEDELKTYNVILKADVQGSLEAIRGALENLSTPKVKLNIVLAGVGGITESDVNLASTTTAAIIGFNVRTAGKSAQLAEQVGVTIFYHSVIYDAVEDTKKAMLGRLEPKFIERTVGRAEVRQLFHVPKIGTIAGCFVLDGKLNRNVQLRLVRDSVKVYEGRIGSLRRHKDDVREVTQGYECGIGIENFNDLKIGDIIEGFESEKVMPTLA